MAPDVKTIGTLIAAIKAYVHDGLRATSAPLEARLAALEARVIAAEKQATQMCYTGVWKPGREYQRGNFSTHDGSIFYCWRDTRDEPSKSDAWQLAVKHGRPGKDAR
jgi:hypothetical protein